MTFLHTPLCVGVGKNVVQKRLRADTAPRQGETTMTGTFDVRYAKALEHAERVLGGRRVAERWMLTPRLGLEGRRPVDLLGNQEDFELLETFLQRIEYGVYH